MTLTVMTGWSPAGWEQYGRQFLDTFDRFWPMDVRLFIYGENDVSGLLWEHLMEAGTDKPKTTRRITFVPLSNVEGCVEFIERHRENPTVQGKERLAHHHWKERAVAAGYNWRFDAWKFCRQGFIPYHCATFCQTDYLCWLDGDVVTQAHVASSKVITGLLPAGKLVAYLGREPKHPDIAFQLYDIRNKPDKLGQVEMPHGYVWQMLGNFAALYRTDAFLSEKEWHSAYIWKRAADIAGAWPYIHNLTPQGTGHVWQQSPLRHWGDHLKGDRKNRAR